MPTLLDGPVDQSLYVDTNGNALTIDTIARSQVVVLFEHYKIHSGDTWSAWHHADRGPSSPYLDVLVRTPNTDKLIHFIYEVDCESEAQVSFMSGTSFSVGGTVLTKFNRRLDLSTTAGLSLYHTPTTAWGGVTLMERHMGSVSSPARFTGFYTETDEWILKKNSVYMVRCFAAVSGWISAKFKWYEHTDLA
jgi:hypothetical protein